MKTPLLTSTCRVFALKTTGLSLGPNLHRLPPAQMKFLHLFSFFPKETHSRAKQSSLTIKAKVMCLSPKADSRPSLVKRVERSSPGRQTSGDISSLTQERDLFIVRSVTAPSSTRGICPNMRANITAWPFLSPASCVGAPSPTSVL